MAISSLYDLPYGRVAPWGTIPYWHCTNFFSGVGSKSETNLEDEFGQITLSVNTYNPTLALHNAKQKLNALRRRQIQSWCARNGYTFERKADDHERP